MLVLVLVQERRHLQLPPDRRSVLLETLYPGSLYVAWVAARAPRGEGAPTAPLSVRTLPLGMCARRPRPLWPMAHSGLAPPRRTPTPRHATPHHATPRHADAAERFQPKE